MSFENLCFTFGFPSAVRRNMKRLSEQLISISEEFFSLSETLFIQSQLSISFFSFSHSPGVPVSSVLLFKSAPHLPQKPSSSLTSNRICNNNSFLSFFHNPEKSLSAFFTLIFSHIPVFVKHPECFHLKAAWRDSCQISLQTRQHRKDMPFGAVIISSYYRIRQ